MPSNIPVAPKSQYEIERDERIKRNEAFMASIGIEPHGKGALPKKAPPSKPRAPKKIPPKSEWRSSSRKRSRSTAKDLPAAVAETRRTHPHTLSQTRSDLGEALQDATASTLRVGERVRAAWRKGRDYYAGEIISVHEAARTCTVAYDDDRSIEEETLPFDMIRRPPPSVALAVGAEVEGDWHGQCCWYPATVTARHADGSYDITYIDDDDTEVNVPADRVRGRGAETNFSDLPPVHQEARAAANTPSDGDAAGSESYSSDAESYSSDAESDSECSSSSSSGSVADY